MTMPSRMPHGYRTLAKERSETLWPHYLQPEQFGYDFRRWVSPYTKGAHTLGGIALVLQDWASADGLHGSPFPEVQHHGRTPGLLTNKRLEELLARVFGKSLRDVYATNAFPFIKPGQMAARLRIADVKVVAQQFLGKELEIANPKLVLALGAVPYAALRHIGINCVRLPHPAARIGDINSHEKAWRSALAGQPLVIRPQR